MPAPSTCDEFLDAVLESGVADEKRLETFLEQWYAVSSMPEDPQDLAEDMVKGGLITPFQKTMYLQGKRRGFIIADKYILLDHIGAGGMGSVFLCEHKVMRRRVAIKVLPPAFAKDPEYLQRFHRESRAAAALDHPNIVRAHDVDQDGNMHFLVMEYIEGSSLHSLVSKEGPLDVQRAADYISQAAAGLQHAHEAGLVHRDIKPGNLLVDRRGTLKILDMGLALFFQEKGESLTTQFDASAVLGTADYLAPEQVIDSHGVDIRADIYSLGMTFYFLLTGKSPYGDEGTVAQKLLWHQMRPPKSVRELRPEVPEGLAAIINKMLAKDRAERYQTPQDVVDALAPYVQGIPGAGQEMEGSSDPDEVIQGVAIETNGEVETLKGSEGAPETLQETGKKEPAPTGPKTPKPTRMDKASPSSKKNRGPKSGKLLTATETKTKIASKGSKSSAKMRRPKEEPAFWNKQRIILASSIGGPILLLVLVGAIWGMAHLFGGGGKKQEATQPAPVPPPMARVNVAQPSRLESAPAQNHTKPATIPATEPLPPPTKLESTRPEPPPATMPMPLATKLETPPPKKTLSLVDYFPKPGDVRYYNLGNYAQNSQTVVQEKWEFRDKTVIDVTIQKVGVIQGEPLTKGGLPKWTSNAVKREKYWYRTTDDFIEFGQKKFGGTQWDKILPLVGTEGQEWKVPLPNGGEKKYTLVKFDVFGGKPAAFVVDIVTYSADADLVTYHTYVKDVGEVVRTLNVEKKGGGSSQLVGELKLVED